MYTTVTANAQSSPHTSSPPPPTPHAVGAVGAGGGGRTEGCLPPEDSSTKLFPPRLATTTPSATSTTSAGPLMPCPQRCSRSKGSMCTHPTHIEGGSTQIRSRRPKRATARACSLPPMTCKNSPLMPNSDTRWLPRSAMATRVPTQDKIAEYNQSSRQVGRFGSLMHNHRVPFPPQKPQQRRKKPHPAG
jgi:hypothetical protein